METRRHFHASTIEREQLFVRLYKNAFPVVCNYVSKRGGDLEQAKDVFQEALVIYYERIVVGQTPLRVAEAAYLMGIAKHLWIQASTKSHRITSLPPTDIAMEEEDQASAQKMLHLLASTGKKCLELLRAFYYDKVTMAQLAENFGYASERSATVQKYKCLEHVRSTVKEKQLQYEDFLA